MASIKCITIDAFSKQRSTIYDYCNGKLVVQSIWQYVLQTICLIFNAALLAGRGNSYCDTSRII